MCMSALGTQYDVKHAQSNTSSCLSVVLLPRRTARLALQAADSCHARRYVAPEVIVVADPKTASKVGLYSTVTIDIQHC